jgi:RHS repeat-associated protein
VVIAEMRYKAWGEVRYSSGSTPTKYSYTGQYSNIGDFGLMFYNARWYDPYLNHMTQPDTIVSDASNPQDYNRYSYARNNPLRYTDPTGHTVTTGDDKEAGCNTPGSPKCILDKYGYNSTEMDRELRNYSRAYRSYNYLTDQNLDDTERYIYSSAKFSADADDIAKLPGFWNRFKAGWNTLVSNGAPLGLAAIIAGGGTDPYGHDTPSIHGNSLNSTKKTTLYELVDAETGEHLKFGITSEANPLDRYSESFMKNKEMLILDEGTRREMHELEHSLIVNNPRGPLQLNNH